MSESMNQLISTFKDDFQCEHAIPVGSGTTGIALILNAVNAKNKKVIIPAMTCPNVAIAVYAAGAIPLVVDVSEADANISVDSILNAMDHDVAAILAVDGFGYPARMPEIKKIADEYKCCVIEDACQAYGGRTDNQFLGTRGTAGIISFGYAKPIDSGTGGGMVLTNDPLIAQRIRHKIGKKEYLIASRLQNKITLKLMLKGKTNWLRQLAGYGIYKFAFLKKTASRVSMQWARLKKDRQKLIDTIKCISDILNSMTGIELFEYESNGWLPWRYSFMVPDAHRRSYLIQKFQALHIPFSHLYQPLTRHFQGMSIHGELDNAEFISRHIVNLKYTMNLNNVSRLLEKLQSLKRAV